MDDSPISNQNVPDRESETESDDSVVLVVEDEHDLADLYTAQLEDRYTIRTAYTGKQTLRLLDTAVDVVLLDRNLDGWSGTDVLTVIQDRGIDCQIAVVTAVKPDFDLTDLPIDEYLTKPVDRDTLRDTVAELLLRSQAPTSQQELLKLVSRRAVLEETKDDEVLRASQEFEKLNARIDIAIDRLDLGDEDIRINSSLARPNQCSECGIHWDIEVDKTVGFIPLASGTWKCIACGNVEHDRGSNDRRVARR